VEGLTNEEEHNKGINEALQYKVANFDLDKAQKLSHRSTPFCMSFKSNLYYNFEFLTLRFELFKVLSHIDFPIFNNINELCFAQQVS